MLTHKKTKLSHSHLLTKSKLDKNKWSSFIELIESPQSVFSKTEKIVNLKLIEKTASFFKNKKQLIHIGIGGSCLGTKAIFQALAPNTNIKFLENIEDNLDELFTEQNYKNLLFHIVSKSGETIEVIFQVKQIINQLKLNGVKSSEYRNYFVLTSSQQDSPLYHFACEHKLIQLLIPQELGGRFSVLSAVSLFPCQFYGLDIKSLLKGANNSNSYLKERSAELQEFGDTIVSLYKEGLNQNVLMPYDSRLVAFTQWFAQLWAESLGKKNQKDKPEGITPIPSFGSRDQHSLLQLYLHGPLNKFIIFLICNDQGIGKAYAPLLNSLQQGCELALKEVERPYTKIKLETLDEENLGELFQFFHYACVYLAVHLDINPYDQPAVEIAKRHTKSLLSCDLLL